MKKPPEFTLRVRPVSGKAWAGVQPSIRLRRAIKALRRAYGLQVISIERKRRKLK